MMLSKSNPSFVGAPLNGEATMGGPAEDLLENDGVLRAMTPRQ